MVEVSVSDKIFCGDPCRKGFRPTFVGPHYYKAFLVPGLHEKSDTFASIMRCA